MDSIGREKLSSAVLRTAPRSPTRWPSPDPATTTHLNLSAGVLLVPKRALTMFIMKRSLCAVSDCPVGLRAEREGGAGVTRLWLGLKSGG